jgi:hypothetical protein
VAPQLANLAPLLAHDVEECLRAAASGHMGLQPGDMGLQPGDIGLQPGDMGLQPGDMGLQPGDMGLQPGAHRAAAWSTDGWRTCTARTQRRSGTRAPAASTARGGLARVGFRVRARLRVEAAGEAEAQAEGEAQGYEAYAESKAGMAFRSRPSGGLAEAGRGVGQPEARSLAPEGQLAEALCHPCFRQAW